MDRTAVFEGKAFTVHDLAPNGKRFLLEFKDETAEGELLQVEVSLCENSGSYTSLPRFWYRNGKTKTILPNYWCIATYATDKRGNCRGKYNPQIGPDMKLDFDFVNEATQENLNTIITEILKRAYGGN